MKTDVLKDKDVILNLKNKAIKDISIEEDKGIIHFKLNGVQKGMYLEDFLEYIKEAQWVTWAELI